MSETSYISCACNRVPNSADWGQNGLVCYGACNAVAIYNPKSCIIGRVTKTLESHNARVNVVRWIRQCDWKDETEILSASTDGTAIIWSLNKHDNYEPTSILKEEKSLTIADAIYLKNSQESMDCRELLICTGSIEGNFALWHRDTTGSANKIQSLNFGSRITTEARLSFLPNSKIPLLALALDDCSIHIWCQNTSLESIKFFEVQILHNHEDWIRCMDFTRDAVDNCLLATGSQDGTIRLWMIYPIEEEISMDTRQNESQRRIKRFNLAEQNYGITLESILSGHEHWVYGVHWHPPVFKNNDEPSRPAALLSCAMDKTMIIWEANLDRDGVWREAVRVGEVGGNSLGFYGCKYAPDGLSILAHSYQGSFHLWKYDEDAQGWIPRTGPTGHFSGVVDLCWDPKGRFLVSVSTDQTTRIHAPWNSDAGVAWHEIGRPQVHGYDLSCLTMLGPYTFASGAEEKVVRVFTAPTTFQKYLSTVTSTDDWEGKLAEGASVPALGLTNKATFDEQTNGNNDERTRDIDYTRPPTEEELIRHTLWPELQKLYGHGYEIFSIASRHDGCRFATACKSATAEHSAIIIWCTKTWSQLQKLSSHRLTVTQMDFSPNDKYLISVSRDRRWALYKINETNDYQIVATSSKTNAFHGRIIWCCGWSPDSKYFATGSRDGKVGLWSVETEKLESGQPTASLEIKDSSVTAVAFELREYSSNSYVIAVGFDNGDIQIHKIDFNNEQASWRTHERYNYPKAHHGTVKRLAFRPNNHSESNETKIAQFASCGLDNTLKIHNLSIVDLETL